jgi:hypothetical protein
MSQPVFRHAPIRSEPATLFGQPPVTMAKVTLSEFVEILCRLLVPARIVGGVGSYGHHAPIHDVEGALEKFREFPNIPLDEEEGFYVCYALEGERFLSLRLDGFHVVLNCKTGRALVRQYEQEDKWSGPALVVTAPFIRWPSGSQYGLPLDRRDLAERIYNHIHGILPDHGI